MQAFTELCMAIIFVPNVKLNAQRLRRGFALNGGLAMVPDNLGRGNSERL